MSGSVAYTVRCAFTGGSAESVAADWVGWLQGEHLRDVLDAGASAAEIVRLDGSVATFEVRYRFPDRAAFVRYEAEHAPRLRDEGLRRFPLELGLEYTRTVGDVLLSVPGGNVSP